MEHLTQLTDKETEIRKEMAEWFSKENRNLKDLKEIVDRLRKVRREIISLVT